MTKYKKETKNEVLCSIKHYKITAAELVTSQFIANFFPPKTHTHFKPENSLRILFVCPRTNVFQIFFADGFITVQCKNSIYDVIFRTISGKCCYTIYA